MVEVTGGQNLAVEVVAGILVAAFALGSYTVWLGQILTNDAAVLCGILGLYIGAGTGIFYQLTGNAIYSHEYGAFAGHVVECFVGVDGFEGVYLFEDGCTHF